MQGANEMTAPGFKIAVLAGDGIGPEVMEPCISILESAVASAGGPKLRFEQISAGAEHYKRAGVSISEDAFASAQDADAILLGAMGLPEIRYPDGTEIAPQLELRETLGLYAGVRPIRTIPGLAPVLSDERARALDIALIRESTEGLFAARGRTVVESNDRAARDTMVITRAVCEKLFDFALDLGEKRRAAGRSGVVTCVDKANVLGALAFFRRIFNERASARPRVITNHAYVDAVGLNLVKQPWIYDVLVTENMFGDILSDVGAALMGGMGFAPSADIGDDHAVFQPCHGSAPDIARQGKANPTAMFLSGAMMLEWLGERCDNATCAKAGALVRHAVDLAFASGELRPFEIGGAAGTRDIADAVADALRESPHIAASA